MKRMLSVVVMILIVAGTWWVAGAQNRGAGRGATPAPASGGPAPQGTPAGRGTGADPYANNAVPGAQTFPLAAAAGKDSNALNVAPMGAVNQRAVRSGDLEVRHRRSTRRPARRSGTR